MRRKQLVRANLQAVKNPNELANQGTGEAALEAIKGVVKIKTAQVWKGRVAKPYHTFYHVSAEWRNKFHWEIREIDVKRMQPEARKELKKILINAMAEKVALYKG